MHLYAPPPTTATAPAAASTARRTGRLPASHAASRPALAALALAAAAGLIATVPAVHAAPATAPASAPASAPVATARLGSGNDRAVTTFSGHLQALQESTVAAQTAGNVLQLAVKAGDRVRAGQVLVRIDERSAQAGLTAADAGVAQADALWRQAQLQAERTRELRRQGFVSQAAQDAADTQLRAAQAGLDQARAGRAQAAVVRGFAGATAPFDGIVLATHVEAGDLAAPGRPLVTLYAPGQLRAVAQVPASRSALARAATQVDVQLPDGRWVVPARRTELPTADPVSQTVEWRLDLPADIAAGLSPGSSVQVRFSGAPVAGTPARPRVPASAVLQRGELSAVYAVRSERFVLQPVRLGAVHADGIELLAGLKPGQAYAVEAVRAGLAGAIPGAIPAATPAPTAPASAVPAVPTSAKP